MAGEDTNQSSSPTIAPPKAPQMVSSIKLPILKKESTSSTNELNVAYSVSTAIGHSSQAQGSSSYADELMSSFFANKSSSLQLDNEDLEDYRTAKNPRNRGRDTIDNGKRPAREEDKKALVRILQESQEKSKKPDKNGHENGKKASDRPMIVDVEEHSIQFRLYLENSSKAITPVLPIEEPEYSLSMRNEHIDTILETELDELIKSSVENLVLIPSKYEVTSDNERIEEADFDLEEEIRLVENLSHDNLSPRPPEELNAEIIDTIVESLSPSPILIEDGDSHMEEIDLFLATDDLMPPGIENDDYNSERDIHFLEELFSNDPILLPKNEPFNFDHYEPSFPLPPPEPSDVEVFFDFEPDSGELISAVMNNIDKLIKDECFDPGGGEINVFANVEDDDYFPFILVIQIFLPYLIYPKVSPLLLFTGSEDTIFNPSIST
nr:hypothetical protein [Tanacetum cinerariifolium]GEY48867.1 hypothetical protein [Tanacetum cinerariifolium]